jgi:DNA-binding PadR family transcriptional regulator
MKPANLEALILSRFHDRCRRAGRFIPGYGMRKEVVAYGLPDSSNVVPVLNALVEKGWLTRNDAGNWYYLTAEGAEKVKAA